MYSHCSLFNYLLGIICIDHRAMYFSILSLLAKTIYFPWLLVVWETFEWNKLWHYFEGLKENFKPQRLRNFSGMCIFWIVYPLSRINLDVDSIIFVNQYWIFYLYVERIRELTSGITILFLTYWSYMLRWMFDFDKSYEII